MTDTGEQRLVNTLFVAPDATMSAVELAERLAVTTRSVRNYVVAAKRTWGDVVQSTRDGYRLDITAYCAARAERSDTPTRGARTPSERLAYIIRTVVASDDPVSVFALADVLHVSESTIEADLTKARALLTEFDVTLVRNRSDVTARATETALRRVMRRFMVDAVASKAQQLDLGELADRWGDPTVLALRERALAVLEQSGLSVNDASTNTLVTHIAIMADRVRRGHAVAYAPVVRRSDVLAEARERMTEVVEELFDVVLPDAEVAYLTFLLAQNAVPDRVEDDTATSAFLDDAYVALITQITERVGEAYAVDLANPRFIAFLSMHVRNLVKRARTGSFDSVPEGMSIRHSHPLVYEIAVFIAQQLHLALDITVSEGEIALISFHVGAYFQGMRDRENRVSVALLVPRYYDVHRTMAQAVDNAIVGVGKVDLVVTDPAKNWTRVDVDVVVSTVPVGVPDGIDVFRVSAIPTVGELDALSDRVREISRRKLRSRVATALVDMFDPALFSRGSASGGSDGVIGMLSARLAESGHVRADYAADVREREAMSPTSFTSGAAIPHAMTMDAVRPGIAVHISDEPIDWAGVPVRLVALFAFSGAERQNVGTLFEGFIHALADPANVRALVSAATSYEGFIQGLLRVL